MKSITDRINIKVLVLGKYGVGKSALLKSFTKTNPIEGGGLTLGVSFVDYDAIIEDQECRFQFWEFVGKREYEFLYSKHFKNANAAIIVFDLSNPETFIEGKRYLKKVNKYLDYELPCAIIGNKLDLVDDINEELDRTAYIKFAEENNGYYYEISEDRINKFKEILKTLYKHTVLIA